MSTLSAHPGELRASISRAIEKLNEAENEIRGALTRYHSECSCSTCRMAATAFEAISNAKSRLQELVDPSRRPF